LSDVYLFPKRITVSTGLLCRGILWQNFFEAGGPTAWASVFDWNQRICDLHRILEAWK